MFISSGNKGTHYASVEESRDCVDVRLYRCERFPVVSFLFSFFVPLYELLFSLPSF